ncbi:MAG: extracellular solute-binding protein family 1 [Paenibacillus sp.]|nr:extracellular solute-binding protein family 1 [Paenibacillus sp.]
MIKRIAAVALLGALATGCGSGGTKNGADQPGMAAKTEPVTLLFYTAQGNYAKEENFESDIGQFIKAKFPHIKLEHIHTAKGAEYQDLIGAGKIPDIVLESSSNVTSAIIRNGLQHDMTALLQKQKLDPNRIDPALLQVVRNFGDGKLNGLPFLGSNYLMFYNKDVFDKFGVPYPRDGMTWDETYELAKKLTRTDGGVQYNGFQADPGLLLKYNPRSLGVLDAKEDKPEVATEAWKQYVSHVKRFYDIPNNPVSNVDNFPKGQYALAVHVAEKVIGWPQVNPNLNWDVVAAPVFKDAPGVGLQSNFYSLFVTGQSKHKDEAAAVIAHLLSDEVQTQLSKKGLITPLVSKDVQKAFGDNMPELKGKNVQAVYANKYATPPPARANGLTFVDGYSKMRAAFVDMMKTNEDVNTVLRKAEEAIKQDIAAAKAMQTNK